MEERSHLTVARNRLQTMSSDVGQRADDKDRRMLLRKIGQRMRARGKTLLEEIQDRSLYFRASLVGACNLHCPFCHNEGAPAVGRADLSFMEQALIAAFDVGFRRVQFTGGEPLLHPQVDKFVARARQIFDDVGITTNGTFIASRLAGLIEAQITRIHVSLQAEELEKWGNGGAWGVPEWLVGLLGLSAEGALKVRLNMPIPADKMDVGFRLLLELTRFGCDVKVFAILPEGDSALQEYPLNTLILAVKEENERRARLGKGGHILLRDFSLPKGIRCKTCVDYVRCKEQSRSLRLGSDRQLRPCLATRVWDSSLDVNDMYGQIYDAALLAVDY